MSNNDNLGQLNIVELGVMKFVDQVKEALLFLGELLTPQRCVKGEWISRPASCISGELQWYSKKATNSVAILRTHPKG